ncbi:hypothetical protein [Lacticaseibacillus suihuaensis]
MDNLNVFLRRTKATQQVVASAIGIAPTTLRRAVAGQAVAPRTAALIAAFLALAPKAQRRQLREAKHAVAAAAKDAAKSKRPVKRTKPKRQSASGLQSQSARAEARKLARRNDQKRLKARLRRTEAETAPVVTATHRTVFIDESFTGDDQMIVSSVTDGPQVVAAMAAQWPGGTWRRGMEVKSGRMTPATLARQCLKLAKAGGYPTALWLAQAAVTSPTPWASLFPYAAVMLWHAQALPSGSRLAVVFDARSDLMTTARLDALQTLVHDFLLRYTGRAVAVVVNADNSLDWLQLQAADVVAGAAGRLSLRELQHAEVTLLMSQQLLATPLYQLFATAFAAAEPPL